MTEKETYNSGTRLTIGDDTSRKSKVWLQHVGALTGCMSAFAVGNTLGWSSPAGPVIIRGELGFPVSESENALLSSMVPIGAAVSCIPTGYITDKIGRKVTLLGLVPIFLLGWGLITYAHSVGMFYAGRFFLGLCAGAACVTAPVYAAEISQKQVRGATGSYFQLLLAGGILFAYLVGSQVELFWLSMSCGAVPIVFGILFFFFPESPIYYLTKGKVEQARKSLKFYRGADYDIEPELYELSKYSEQKYDGESTWRVFTSRQGMKSLGLSIGMMIFQQLSGINAFVFNSTDIFEHAGSSLEAKYETVITGVMQVGGTLFATFLVDKLGRVVLLGISAVSMAISTFFLGLYFSLMDDQYEVEGFSWLPLLCLCLFIIMFAVGYGAVPWMLMSELIPSKIKGSASAIACFVNWLSAFLVTEFFFDFERIFGRGITFWIFTGICTLAAVFSFKALPETKGKSFEEIQRELCK